MCAIELRKHDHIMSESPAPCGSIALARRMLADMSERARWIYALPRSPRTLRVVTARLAAAGAGRLRQKSAASWVVEHVTGSERCRLGAYDSADLNCLLLLGEGAEAPPVLAGILEHTGFLPQSRLWDEALATARPGAPRALAILAHMCVAWSEEYADLLRRHLEADDENVRGQAVDSLCVAALLAAEPVRGAQLLQAVKQREMSPEVADKASAAADLLRAVAGEAATVRPESASE